MTVSKNRPSSAKRQAAYSIAAVLLGILTAASCLAVVSLGNDLDEASFLRLLIAEIGMLFAFALYIGCGGLSVESTPGVGTTVTVRINHQENER